MKKTVLMISVLTAGACAVQAQAPATGKNPIAEGQASLQNMVKGNLLKAAEKMPEEHYAFKPTPDVRSFGQLIGHVADAQYLFCSPVMGKANPAPAVEKTKTSKADLVKALNEALAYCDQAYRGLTDAEAAAIVKFFGSDRSKVTVLSFNTMHNMEHYGNIVTYLRLKNIVPPSSEGR